MKSFYKKFEIFSHLPFWRPYLRIVYFKAFADSSSFGISPLEKRENFTCLLCGVSGEITADEFIKFVLGKIPNSKIIIIDIGDEQIQSVNNLVKNMYPNENIVIRQANALDLNFIEGKTIDWIDTDGFFSFFDEAQLRGLFKEWKRILKDDGFITFRELISSGSMSSTANRLRALFSRIYIGINLNLHSQKELLKDFNEFELLYNTGRSPIPLLDCYCLSKSNLK